MSNTNKRILLVTPPFTQLNTPYPATAYLKRFLLNNGVPTFQADLGIEVILELFSKDGLKKLFRESERYINNSSDNCKRILKLSENYINSIEEVISFLQGSNPTLANIICQNGFLPEASRFNQLDKSDWAFGTMGITDKAKHLATLYLEDISDFIREVVDPDFGFSRYAESLGRSANTFAPLESKLLKGETFIDKITLSILDAHIQKHKPAIIGLSIPFPGNVYSGFRCGKFIKEQYPDIKIIMGGGYPNTELRDITDEKAFKYLDFICLDDGEAPLLSIINYLNSPIELNNIKRSFMFRNDQVQYIDNKTTKEYSLNETGTPDYSDLLLNKYISAIEITNPVHRLWSDGRWNKLTLAHGCYWGRCTFCDTSLDYIKRFEQQNASIICDKIEKVTHDTGERGFHFVDEAAPPALLRELALELIRRKINIIWWVNIRFEKNFTEDLCQLLSKSGCIAVSGGLEVASDRLLSIINKGVTVAQVAQVTNSFTKANIMVHAYLMYGFPTQTAQETIDSLEIVRQMFHEGIVHSGYWHRFTMTAHSPVGLNPDRFNVEIKDKTQGSFANNDVMHIDKNGTEHEKFSYGLKKALFNYMHGICFDYEAHEWFNSKELGYSPPKTSIPRNLIKSYLKKQSFYDISPSKKIFWLNPLPEIKHFTKKKKGKVVNMVELLFSNNTEDFSITLNNKQGEWLYNILPSLSVYNSTTADIKELAEQYNKSKLGNFDVFFNSKPIIRLRKKGLLVI